MGVSAVIPTAGRELCSKLRMLNNFGRRFFTLYRMTGVRWDFRIVKQALFLDYLL